MNKLGKPEKRNSSNESRKNRARSKKAKEKTALEILNVAKKEFLEQGSERATMRRIAKNAGMTVGNLYTYYSSKQELWNTIVNEYFKEFTKKIVDILSITDQNPIQIFDKIAEMFFSFAKSDPDRFKMMFFVPPPSSTKRHFRSYSIDLTFIDLIRGILQKAIQNGKLEVGIIDFYANLFGAIGIGSVLMISPELGNFGGGFTSEKEKNDFLDFVRSKIPAFFK